MQDPESQKPEGGSRKAEAADDILMRTQIWFRRLNYDPTPVAQAQLQRDLAAIQVAAKADKHDVIGATHVMELDGEVVGYASIGAIPLVNFWMDSRKQRPRDAMTIVNLVENEAARMGFHVMCVPCAPQSPFRKIMKKFGYDFLMESGFFTKHLRR